MSKEFLLKHVAVSQKGLERGLTKAAEGKEQEDPDRE
jgi:hypothetical protein